MPRSQRADTLTFVAALADGRSFTIDREGQARLVLEIPEQYAAHVAAGLPRIRDRALGVALQPVEGE